MYDGVPSDEQRKKLRLSTMQMIVFGFMFVILIGAVLLCLPISNVGGEIKFIDALFSATSAVCVTGLMTVVPATQFTIFGKIVILCLIQIGGLGVVCCAMMFFIIIGKRITVKERVIIQESYNLDTLSGLVHMIIRIIKITIIVELVGAVFFAFQFIPEYGILTGMWYALFHAISAFCNAGIDLIGGDSFAPYMLNPIVNFTTTTLIIIGGLGFPVWIDLKKTIELYRKNKFELRKFPRKLQLHSQIAILVTVTLIVSGTLLYLALEWSNPATLGDLEPLQKLMVAFFQSVTTRTAGFSTVNQGGLLEGTAFLTCIFMFIGGSPAGTAGGVKTTTVFMLLLTCRSVIRGSKDTECFGRRVPEENIKTGLSIIIIAGTALITGVLLMCVFEDFQFIDILYEVCSALGTVGLTRGITPNLDVVGKCVDIILMYIGRLGPITMALAFGYRKNPTMNLRELPTKRLIVG